MISEPSSYLFSQRSIPSLPVKTATALNVAYYLAQIAVPHFLRQAGTHLWEMSQSSPWLRSWVGLSSNTSSGAAIDVRSQASTSLLSPLKDLATDATMQKKYLPFLIGCIVIGILVKKCRTVENTYRIDAREKLKRGETVVITIVDGDKRTSITLKPKKKKVRP